MRNNDQPSTFRLGQTSLKQQSHYFDTIRPSGYRLCTLLDESAQVGLHSWQTRDNKHMLREHIMSFIRQVMIRWYILQVSVYTMLKYTGKYLTKQNTYML